MKTPRQILFERHRSAETKLDEIRARALTEMSNAKTQDRDKKVFVPLESFTSLRELLLSLRWHFAGMSAIWLFVLFLNVEYSSPSTTTIARKNTPSPQQVIMALLENRRQVAELTSSPVNDAPAISVPRSFLPPRRSEFSSSTEMA